MEWAKLVEGLNPVKYSYIASTVDSTSLMNLAFLLADKPDARSNCDSIANRLESILLQLLRSSSLAWSPSCECAETRSN